MNNKIIILNGCGGTGKNTFVDLCKIFNPKVMHTSMIDYTKKIARELGWDGEKTEKDRKFLSNLKDTIDEYNDLSFKYVDKYIMSCKNKIVFIDAREPKDIDRLANKYNALKVLVINNNIPHISSNHADNEVFETQYDIVIDNSDSLDRLRESAEIFMKLMEFKDEEINYITHTSSSLIPTIIDMDYLKELKDGVR